MTLVHELMLPMKHGETETSLPISPVLSHCDRPTVAFLFTLSPKTMLKPQEIAQELSKLTGNQWEATYENDYGWGCNAEIRLKNSQAHLFLNYNERVKKLSISGGFQVKTDYGSENLYHERMSIGVSPNKSPAQMARDINRRLLPDYLVEFEKAFQSHCEWEVYRKQRLETLKSLAEIVGIKPKLEPHSDRIYGYGKVKEIIACSTIDLKLSVSQEEAVKILELIA